MARGHPAGAVIDLPRENIDSNSAPPAPQGIYVPNYWGQYWQAARAKSATQQAVVTHLGDSTPRYWTSRLDFKSWSALMRIALQAQYGDGGSGWKGVADTKTTFEDGSTPNSGYANADMGVTTGGTWNFYLGTGTATQLRSGANVSNSFFNDGPGCSFLCNALATGGTPFGGTLTFSNIRGTTVRVYYLTYSGGPTFTVAIDGGAAQNVNTNAATGVGVATYSGLTAGNHTVLITAPATTTYICGVSGENAVGVIYDNFCRLGYSSGAFANTNLAFGSGAAWSGGPSFTRQPDLAIYSLGANDAAIANATPDAYALNVRHSLQQLKESAPKQGAVDVLFVLSHPGKSEPAGQELMASYADRIFGLAQHYGAAVINLGTLYRNSWDYANSLSFWSDGTADGLPGTDTVHPGDLGHASIWARLNAALPALVN